MYYLICGTVTPLIQDVSADTVIHFATSHFDLSAIDILKLCEGELVVVECVKSGTSLTARFRYDIRLFKEGSNAYNNWKMCCAFWSDIQRMKWKL